MSKFQIILLIIFGAFILVAVMVFALYRGGSRESQVAVTVWGDITANDFDLLANNAQLYQDQSIVIRYVPKSASTIEAEFTEALAQGSGPDLIILSQDQFWQNRNKLLAIPYQSITERDFRETFIEAGEIYLTPDGIYGLPLSIDPLILYYNRDLLSAAGVAKPMAYWDEIYASTLNLSKRDPAGNLVQSAIALGETRNIKNFKDILATLFMQAGTPITAFSGTELHSVLEQSYELPVAPAQSAIEFYTQFSNPSKTYYSWNRVLPEAQTRFAAGDLAYYVGFASELRALRNKNPTLNFALAPLPQSRVANKTLTTGKLRAVSISRGAKNPTAALSAALKLASRDVSLELAEVLVLPPTRRDLLSERPTDSVFPVLYTSALQAKSWIDPNNEGTQKVFADMIDSVTSGRARTSESVTTASNQLEALIGN